MSGARQNSGAPVPGAGGTPLEIRTERDEALPFTATAYEGPILRVKYRPVGTRRWTTFLLVPDEGEGYEELEQQAAGAVAAHRRQFGTPAAEPPPKSAVASKPAGGGTDG